MDKAQSLKEQIQDHKPQMVEDLAGLVSIPSVSSDPKCENAMQESALFVASLFEKEGFETEIIRAAAEDGEMGQPAVLARRTVSPDAPTVLLYAHHDVQPAGELSTWATEPFTLVERNDRLFGRGSADDGAGIIVHAAAAHLTKDAKINLVVFVEGEEEIGSPSFSNFLKDQKEKLRADYIVVADSNNWTVDIPALTSSLRGVCSVDVEVKVLEHAVHSGMFGGPILDAVTLASRLIATLHDDHGTVAVDGLAGSPASDVHWDEAQFRKDASVVDGYSLAGVGDLASRVWTQPAIAVIGFDARSVEDSSNTIAASCRFRLSLRTVPGVDPQESLSALTRHLLQNAPFGAQVQVTELETGPGYLAAADGQGARLFREALEEAWGTKPVNIGVGGSIPFISEFQQAFPESEVLVTGIEDPQTNAHSENESMSSKVLVNAAFAEAFFLSQVAGAQ